MALRVAADAGHRCEGATTSVTFSPARREGKNFPHSLNDVWPPQYANAVIVTGNMPVAQFIDTNLFHAACGHVQEGLLLRTVKDIGTTLSRQLQPCTECSIAEYLRQGTPPSAHSRSPKKLGRIFVDLDGLKPENILFATSPMLLRPFSTF